MSAPPSVPASPRPRAARWLTGAAALALAVQAIFLLVPEPKSAGATDPAAPEAAAPFDSTAFTLEEDATVLPGENHLTAADSAQPRAVTPVDSAQVAAPRDTLQSRAAPDDQPDSAATPGE